MKILLITIAAATVLAGPLAAQVAGADRIAITDPVLLEQLGFPPDAEGIYALPKALESILALGEREDAEPRLYGTSDRSVTSISALDVTGERQSTFLLHGITTVQCHDSSSWAYGVAQVRVPTGAALEELTFTGNDTAADNALEVYLWESCHPAFGGQTNTLLSTLDTFSSIGYQRRFVVIDPPVTVGPSEDCSYNLRVNFSRDQPGCFNSALQLMHAGVHWRRQVSPAPQTATFSDVPTGHPFFPFVEALAASGVTAGCGGGNYCPDSSITRGQMAVFFAAALGLHWPEE